MIEVSNIDVWGFEHAIRGMRNPMNSWGSSDSYWAEREPDAIDTSTRYFKVGTNDLSLMQRLYSASLSGDNHAHRKYLRQIMVSMDILAPRYWWCEFDTYKVGTTANSTSTMHKIASKEFTIDDFSTDHLMYSSNDTMNATISKLNFWRDIYLNGGSSDEGPKGIVRSVFKPKDKEVWWQLIQLLPGSYNQLRTVTMNYENVFTIINQRSGHKLDEWNVFVSVLWKLPYVKVIRSDSN